MSANTQAISGKQDSAVVVTLLEPFARLLARPDLYELVVNTPGEILTEGRDGWTRHEAPELTFDRLMRLARAVASTSSQVIDETRPVLSATLPGDERIQIVIPPAVTRGRGAVRLGARVLLCGRESASRLALVRRQPGRRENHDGGVRGTETRSCHRPRRSVAASDAGRHDRHLAAEDLDTRLAPGRVGAVRAGW